MRPTPTRLGSFVLLASILVACGGGSDGGGGGSGPDIALSKSGGDAQIGVVHQQLVQTARVTVTEDGNPKEDAIVTWTPTAGSGSVPSPTSLTAADGTASSTWTLGNVSGAQSLKAAVSGATPANVTFTATGTPDVASGIEKASGDAQTGEVGNELDDPLAVKVVDQFDNGRAGTTVTWAVASGDATVFPLTSNSSNTGLATTVVTLGPTAGPVTITATAGALLGSPLTFDATAVVPPPPPASIVISVVNFAFTPKNSVLAVGGVARWTWGAGSAGHNVRSDGPPSFNGMPAGIPQSAPFTHGPIIFSTAGTYKFYCQFHGNIGGVGMAGTIKVQ